jgi:hypothetical protein
MITTLLRVAAWGALLAILAITLGPIGMRPVSGGPVQIERFLAFAVLGGLFGLAYPGRWRTVLALVVGAAIGFEILQAVTPDRHGRFADLAVKAAGGAVGVILAQAIAAVALRRG